MSDQHDVTEVTTTSSFYAGMFFLATSILYLLEVFATRVFAFVSGPEYLYATIAVAMLGMSGAASLVSLMRDPVDVQRARPAAPCSVR